MSLPASFLTAPIAHRAYHDKAAGRVENSPAAIRAAVEAGYGIEIDLQLSADGQAMVFHDYDLKRLTGQPGPIRGKTAAELGQITLTGGNDTIPTFAQVLEMVAGRVPLLVEIKDQDGAMGANVGQLERAAAEAAQGYDGPLAFMSFNPNSVLQMAILAPDIPRGLTTSAYTQQDWQLLPARTRDKLREIPDYDSTGSCFISHEAADLERPRVADLKRRGAAVLCWTIRSPQAEAKAREVAQNVTFEGYAAAIPA
ncbi:phosphodiesterase [Thalassobius vesicularis]|uniref:Phosphodiesterase n=1 Tax=Thalassobius vesicularis TaxID=1294297 RepID=A0A4S3M9C0_9RHOB|nr:glycerophosphodiester phosphodiesterase family protein [Thalassobius vesicularis]THD74082.1 phosphodiesterase [Thalassobius vesicularis]